MGRIEAANNRSDVSDFDGLLDIYTQMEVRMSVRSAVSEVVRFTDLVDVDVEEAIDGQGIIRQSGVWIPGSAGEIGVHETAFDHTLLASALQPEDLGVTVQPYRQNRYSATFSDASLSVAGILPVTHNLGGHVSSVLIRNASGEVVNPDRIELLSLNDLSVSLEAYRPIGGIWRVEVEI